MVIKKVAKSTYPLTVGKEDILRLSDGALKLYMYFLSLPFNTNPTMELAIDYLGWSDKKYKRCKKELVDNYYIFTKKNSVKGGGSAYDYYVGKVAVAEKINSIYGN